MLIQVVIFLLLFLFLFELFWNIKKWKVSVVKVIALVLFCAAVSMGCTVGSFFLLNNFHFAIAK